MRNKKWKRKAKRVYGECIKYTRCLDGCKYVNDCPISEPIGYLWIVGLREMEKCFKGNGVEVK